jgi:predicted signal transduction protein with EAL and GGDEF domain
MRAVTGLARNLKIETPAEGVETEGQLDHVRELGCTEMQGYLFSAPVPVRELSRLFARTLARRRGAAAPPDPRRLEHDPEKSADVSEKIRRQNKKIVRRVDLI